MALTKPHNGAMKVLSKPEEAGITEDRGLLKEKAYLELKQRILDGTFAPGTFLAERQLAQQLGMSKTPIRAALERLELGGFITVSPQQGILVRDLTIQDIADQYEIRLALETFVLRAVSGRLTDSQKDQLHGNLVEQEANTRGGSVDQAVQLDADFHILFGEFLGNQEILRVMSHLRDKMRRIIARVYRLNPGRILTSYQEHSAIAEAVLLGDAALAAQRIEDHLEFGKQCLLSPRRH